MTYYRQLTLLCILLIIAACGPEAPARVARPTVPKPVAAALIEAEQPTIRPAVANDVRTMGDPAAPIVVIEYGDYQ